MKKILAVVVLFVMLFTITSCGLIYYDTSSSSSTKEAQSANVIQREPDVEALQKQVQEVYDEVSTSCVAVVSSFVSSTTGKTVSASGSGVIYKSDDAGNYFVLTNNHVIYEAEAGGEASEIKVYFGPDYGFAKAYLEARDSTVDLAILQFNLDLLSTKPMLSVAKLDDQTDIVSVGQSVLAIGSPLGIENYNYLTTGHVSKVTDQFVSHDAGINPGNSGGGLFNLAGRLIGINVSKQATTTADGSEIPVEGMSNAISIALVKSDIELMESKSVITEKPLLGVLVSTFYRGLLNDEATLSLVPDTLQTGVIIQDFTVQNKGNAFNAGMQVNDILYSVNGNRIKSADDLRYVLITSDFGDTLNFVVYRKSGDNFITVNISITLSK